MKNSKVALSALFLLVFLSGCSTPPTKEQIGTVAGAVVGGAAGAALGGTLVTVGGAAAGALIGNKVGEHMDNTQ